MNNIEKTRDEIYEENLVNNSKKRVKHAGALGATMLGLGGGSYAVAKAAEHYSKKPLGIPPPSPGTIKGVKGAGIGLATTGGLLVGYSLYKHYKNKTKAEKSGN